ncbi:hypothetical protein AB6A40_009759 [Gnathostoma spinigerum]|uniref:Uncharacterized protein n=1 Tax=Gnathostoma spinigerum TaxID=75299 RepID=A0ABD6EU61_9BILA
MKCCSFKMYLPFILINRLCLLMLISSILCGSSTDDLPDFLRDLPRPVIDEFRKIFLTDDKKDEEKLQREARNFIYYLGEPYRRRFADFEVKLRKYKAYIKWANSNNENLPPEQVKKTADTMLAALIASIGANSTTLS